MQVMKSVCLPGLIESRTARENAGSGKLTPKHLRNNRQERTIGYFDAFRERNILNELDSPHIIKLHDSWIENAGKENARLVLIMEDGGESVPFGTHRQSGSASQCHERHPPCD